jgi:hydroxyacylglutathione hydrolase
MATMKKRASGFVALAGAGIIAAALSFGCASSKANGASKAEPEKAEALSEAIRSRYIVSEYSPGVWRIDEHGQVNMFLVAGKDKALLIDTGFGEPGLDAVVASLTSLPVAVVDTHGHDDHAGGNKYFDEIYAHPGDMSVVKHFSPGKKVREVRAGYEFDLGGRKLSVIETPGHTRGSICLLDAENRILFTGDNNNSHIWLFLEESLSVEEYLKSLEALIAREGEFDVMLIGHGGQTSPAFLDGIAECAREILKGGVESQTYRNLPNARSYVTMGALIAFDPNKIRAK